MFFHLRRYRSFYSLPANSEGQGPAWANSLFEDNAEYGFGMAVGVHNLRKRIAQKMQEAIKENMMSVGHWMHSGNGLRERRCRKIESGT